MEKQMKLTVEEILNKLNRAGIKYDKKIKISTAKVYDDNPEQMLRNVLAVLNIGISDKKIKEIC